MHTEYTTPGGELWRIEDGEDLMREFGLDGADMLPGWHQALAGQGRCWEVIKRYYGVASVLAAAEDFEPMSPDQIAKEFQIRPADVDHEIDQAVALWNSRLTAAAVARQVEESAELADGLSDGAVDSGQVAGINRAFQTSQGLSEEEIDRILESYQFDDIEDPIERRTAATRLVEFDNVAADAESRILITTMIRQELDVTALNRIITEERTKLRQKNKGGSQKHLREVIADRDKALDKLKATLEKVGDLGGGGPGPAERARFQDCVGWMVEAVREYYAEGNNALIDGIFTATEVQFLLEPVAERPYQYDPQMVIEGYWAQQTIWVRDFEGQRINRNASRRLRKAFKTALDLLNEEAGMLARSLEDGDDFDREELEEELAKTATGSDVAIGESLPASPGEGSPVDERSDAWQQMHQPGRGEGSFVGV